jgi:hypothetical protein
MPAKEIDHRQRETALFPVKRREDDGGEGRAAAFMRHISGTDTAEERREDGRQMTAISSNQGIRFRTAGRSSTSRVRRSRRRRGVRDRRRGPKRIRRRPSKWMIAMTDHPAK